MFHFGKSGCIQTCFAMNGKCCRVGGNLIGSELKIGVGDCGTFGNIHIQEAEANDLITAIIDQIESAATEAHVARGTFFDIIATT